MGLLAEISFDQFEKEWAPETLKGQGYSFLDCQILENGNTAILQIYAAAVWRLFDGKFGVINVSIKTKEELKKASEFFENSKKVLIEKIVKDIESANLTISIEDDYSEIYEKLR